MSNIGTGEGFPTRGGLEDEPITKHDELVKRLIVACKATAAEIDETYSQGGYKTPQKDAHPLMWEAQLAITRLNADLAFALEALQDVVNAFTGSYLLSHPVSKAALAKARAAAELAKYKREG